MNGSIFQIGIRPSVASSYVGIHPSPTSTSMYCRFCIGIKILGRHCLHRADSLSIARIRPSSPAPLLSLSSTPPS
jgi:hypothetical protein